MRPEFKAANAELLKAIKMNDKSDAIPHADLEAINKAMKANDGEKVGTGLKKVQLKLKDSEKKLNEDLKDVTQRFSEAQKDIDSQKEKSKQIKSVQQLFDKAKTLVDSLKTSPKNASKLTSITDKLKQYGDLSGKAQKVIQLVSAGKDASKQIEALAKAVLAAEKKFKKESSASDKEFNKSRDSYIVLKERLKICKDKLAAFQKERLFIANVVKMMPGSSLVQTENGRQNAERELNSAINEGKKLYEEISKIKERERKTYQEETKIFKQWQNEEKSILKKYKNKISSLYREINIIEPRIEKNVKGTVFDEIAKLDLSNSGVIRDNLLKQTVYLLREHHDATTKSVKDNIEKNVDIIREMIRKIDEMNRVLWQLGKSLDKQLENEHTRPDLEKSERINRFNKMLNYATEEQRAKIVELLHKFGQPSATKPAKDFEEFKKWMIIGFERIKNDIV